MSVIEEFRSQLRYLFHMEDEFEVILKWEIPFSEAASIVKTGKLPEVSITFPIEDCRQLSTWESIYLQSIRLSKDASLMIRPQENRAVYDLLLVRRKRA